MCTQSTLSDLARWDALFYRAPNALAALVPALLQRGRLHDGRILDYAGGLLVEEYRGHQTVSHAGAWAGYRAELLRFPQLGWSIALLCNRGDLDPSHLALEIADLILNGATPPADHDGPAADGRPNTGVDVSVSAEKAEASACDGTARAGLYWNEDEGLWRRIALREGRFYYQRDDGSEIAIDTDDAGVPSRLPLPDGDYRIAWHEAGLRLLGPDLPPLEFVRVEPFAPGADELAAIAGRYRSEELGIDWELVLQAGQLWLSSPRDPPLALLPLFDSSFGSHGLRLRVLRDPRGAVAGLRVDAGRARGIGFQRLAGSAP